MIRLVHMSWKQCSVEAQYIWWGLFFPTGNRRSSSDTGIGQVRRASGKQCHMRWPEAMVD
jgi:hypothetical protein